MRFVLALGVLVVLASPHALAWTYGVDCDLTGTDGRDFLQGHGVLCSGPGRDFLSGGSRNDVLRGGPDPDTLVGGGGRDRLNGGNGNDKLFSVDGFGDVLIGGRGFDHCFGDRRDTFRRCEEVHRPKPTTTITAFSKALTSSIDVASEETVRPPCKDAPGCGAEQGGGK